MGHRGGTCGRCLFCVFVYVFTLGSAFQSGGATRPLAFWLITLPRAPPLACLGGSSADRTVTSRGSSGEFAL